VTIPPDRKLSRSFIWREFRQRDGVMPPASSWPAYVELVQRFLQPLRDAMGPVVITSGYRSQTYNARVGGARASRHVPTSEPGVVAADISVPGRSPREVYAALEKMGAPGLGLYSTHVHVDTRAIPARWRG
jgi:zinc D-Ala-D-Ala carboxypeptidase